MTEKPKNEEWCWTLDEAVAAPTKPGARSAELFTHGTARILYYQPKGRDEQTPHDQDEVYVVARGEGWFVNGGRRHRFKPHDVLFVPAGVEHRFEDFTDDFGVWVLFYGPKGGEGTS